MAQPIDLERATSMARRMVTELGMSPGVGPLALAGDPSPSSRQISDRTSSVVDFAVRDVIMQGYGRALELVRQHRQSLDRLTVALLALESIDGPKVEALLGD